jgi:hypothetical protein
VFVLTLDGGRCSAGSHGDSSGWTAVLSLSDGPVSTPGVPGRPCVGAPQDVRVRRRRTICQPGGPGRTRGVARQHGLTRPDPPVGSTAGRSRARLLSLRAPLTICEIRGNAG